MQGINKRSDAGFSLVEIAIVVVIIGLIVGGVLIGRDLIQSAGLRSTMSQMEKYNTATANFRDKYRALPGDIRAAQAATYGMEARSGADGHGDGDKQLEPCINAAAASATRQAGCETLLFWKDLASAEMIEGSYTTATDGTQAIAEDDLAAFFPQAEMGRGNYVTVFTYGHKNYFEITGITSVNGAGLYTLTSKITPVEAFSIDQKVDDGLPTVGAAQGLDCYIAGRAPPPCSYLNHAPTVNLGCTSNSEVPNPYNTADSAKANANICQLRFDMN